MWAISTWLDATTADTAMPPRHRRNHALGTLAGGVFAAVAMYGSACGSSATDELVADAGRPHDAGHDGYIPADDASPDVVLTDPPGVPPGWKRLDVFPRICGFFGPTTPEGLIGPAKGITWTACPTGVVPDGLVCSRIAADWASTRRADLLSSWVSASRDAQSRLQLALIKFVDDYAYELIVDADSGAAKNAVLDTDLGSCGLGGGSALSSDRYVFNFASVPIVGAFVAGRIGEMVPDAIIRFDTSGHVPHATPFGIVDLTNALDLYDWNGAPQGRLWSSANDRLDHEGLVASATRIFWTGNSPVVMRVQSFAPETGAGDFISEGSDTTKGDGDLGTDGNDMVWVRGFGRTKDFVYPTLDIMTSAYSDTPSGLAPRRLRSEEGGWSVGASPFVVGCGYAARSNASGRRIVRLSDGQSWILPSATGSLHWSVPVALTCDEIFLLAAEAGTNVMTIARVRLDSLGPGIPPD